MLPKSVNDNYVICHANDNYINSILTWDFIMTKKLKKGSTEVATRARPSRIASDLKKLDRLKVNGVNADSVVYAVRVVQERTPIKLPGIILDMNANTLVIQHFKPRSSVEQVSHIAMRDVIECTGGGVGEKNVVTYNGDRTLLEVKRAAVTQKDNRLIIKDRDTGDVSLVFTDRPGVRAYITGAAEGADIKPKKKATFKK